MIHSSTAETLCFRGQSELETDFILFLHPRYGARLDVRQADDSTPMHMVCGQGNLEVVKLMFETAPEQARATLFMFDKLDQTPLHK